MKKDGVLVKMMETKVLVDLYLFGVYIEDIILSKLESACTITI